MLLTYNLSRWTRSFVGRSPLLFALVLSLPLSTVVPAEARFFSRSTLGQRGSAANDENRARALEPGQSVERELKSGDVHSYRITLATDQYLDVGVEPRDIEVNVKLTDPEGKLIVEVDSAQGLGPVVWVAEASGTHMLEVRALQDGTAAGSYEVKLKELRAATPQDKIRVAAERAVAEGVRLQYQQGTTESLGAAVKKYEEALSLWQELGESSKKEVSTLGCLAGLYSSLGDYRKAIEYYGRQLQRFQVLRDRGREALTLESIGRNYSYLSDKEKSLDYFNRALQIYQEIGPPSGEVRTLTAIGKIYNNLGETPGERRKALGYYSRALVIHRQAGDRFREGDSLGNLMLAWKSLGRTRQAIFHGKKAVNMFQEIRTSISVLEKDTQQTFLKSKEDIYRTLADLLISEGRLSEAHQVLRMLKEEEYFEFIRRNSNEGASLTVRAALTPKEEELAKRSRQIEDQITTRGRQKGELLAKTSRTADEERLLTKVEADLRVAGQTYQRIIDQLYDEFGNTKQAGRVEQLRELEALMDDLRELGEGAVALFTIVGEEKYRIILITPDIPKAAEYSIKATDLNRKVAAFREALQDQHADHLPLAQELYRILVAPVAKDLRDAGAETLMWSLDGVLRYVPIAALHDGERYLVERFRNVVFTPASNSRLKDQPSAKWKGHGLGVSKAHTGFRPLPAVPEELRSIFREEDAGNTAGGVLPGKVILDEAFTEEGMNIALRRRYPVVHIASHFMFRPGDETNSFLLLGDGRRLSLADIKTTVNLFRGVELLTLSACDTGTGGTGEDGKEVENFGVLAQRKGAKAVTATLWSVADQSTRLLMENFYRLRNDNSGMSKAEALRQAQLALLRGEEKEPRVQKAGFKIDTGQNTNGNSSAEPRSGGDLAATFAHPYFWAPFILIGNWK